MHKYKFFCSKCGAELKEKSYCDTTLSQMCGLVYCKKCYLQIGHVECICGAMLLSEWNYCPVCGGKNESKID